MKKPILVAVVVALVAGFFLFDLGQYLSLENIKAQQQGITDYYEANRTLALIIYFVMYVVITGASLPGAAVLTLAGGAVFGFWTGLVLVSFASTIGATLAFLLSRYLFRDMVNARFGSSLKSLDEGVKREGAFYLFALRLVPLFPFFVINLVMGLTAIKATTFYWVSQLGMLAGTIV